MTRRRWAGPWWLDKRAAVWRRPIHTDEELSEGERVWIEANGRWRA